jgi:hypothetical protein
MLVQPTAAVPSAVQAAPSIATKRPTETLTAVGALAVVLARVFGVDNDNTMTALTVLIGFLPAGITWLVNLISSTRAAAPATFTLPDPLAGAAKPLVAATEDVLARAKAAGNLEQEVEILTKLAEAIRGTASPAQIRP